MEEQEQQEQKQEQQGVGLRARIAPILPLLVGVAALLVVALVVTLVRQSGESEAPEVETTQTPEEGPAFNFIEPTSEPAPFQLPGVKESMEVEASEVAEPKVVEKLPETGLPAFAVGIASAGLVAIGLLFKRITRKR
ncbi:hypothetical protein CMO96_03580 [Candidatus Woesebacteria bacterium]|nr:hypothetical protein [Candidatus Woesebacteria bacterium]|tara:strand:- start:107 stop:517 length:411 start_codon:yes stop_codon:yes gene_type:complete